LLIHLGKTNVEILQSFLQHFEVPRVPAAFQLAADSGSGKQQHFFPAQPLDLSRIKMRTGRLFGIAGGRFDLGFD
jgi:hypothetical protein